MERVDLNEETGTACPKCGSDMEWENCWCCHGDGEFDAYDEDPVNFAPGEEYERCDECKGRGGYLVCPHCAK